MTDESIHVLAVKHAFSQDTVECELPAGLTLREIIGERAGDGLAVTVDGEPIECDAWALTTPGPGSTVTVCPLPHGDSTKTIVLTLGLIAAAYFTGGLVAGLGAFKGTMFANAAIWQGAIYAVGSLALAQLVRSLPPARAGASDQVIDPAGL